MLMLIARKKGMGGLLFVEAFLSQRNSFDEGRMCSSFIFVKFLPRLYFRIIGDSPAILIVFVIL